MATPSFTGRIPWSLPDSDTKKADSQKESAFFIYLISVPEPIRKRSNPIFHTDVSAPDEKILEQVKEICEPLLQAYGFEPVFYDVTRTGRRMWVTS